MAPTDTPLELRPRPSREAIDPAAREIVRRHRDEVMACARRWAETPEDAEDAFQRGLEIMLTKAPTTDPEHLLPWLKTVVKREAWAVRRQRERHTPPASEPDDLDSPGFTTAHDTAVCFERLQLGAEALQRLKPQEVRAFVLKAEGLSYREICEETGWTYTKVNRCLSEGRRRFHDRLAGIEAGAECERLAPQLSALADGEATAADMNLLRPHLRTCLMCRARLRDYRAVPAKVAAVAPPVAAAPALLAWLSERSAGLAVRWHQAIEAGLAHKGAAVMASAAVLGGGGAATIATAERERSADPAPAAASTAEPKRQSTAVVAAPPAERPVPEPRERPKQATKRTEPAPAPAAAERPVEPDAEFAPEPAASGPAAEAQAPSTRARPPGPPAGGEFSP